MFPSPSPSSSSDGFSKTIDDILHLDIHDRGLANPDDLHKDSSYFSHRIPRNEYNTIYSSLQEKLKEYNELKDRIDRIIGNIHKV